MVRPPHAPRLAKAALNLRPPCSYEPPAQCSSVASSLSDVVREELGRVAARPSRQELFEGIGSGGHPRLSEPLADAVRRMRDRAA